MLSKLLRYSLEMEHTCASSRKVHRSNLCGYTSVQVVLELLDPRNILINLLPPNRESQAWTVLQKETSWAAAMSHSESVTAEQIADREIGLWKMRSHSLPKTEDPLLEWKKCDEQ